jgi:hypothetical protein
MVKEVKQLEKDGAAVGFKQLINKYNNEELRQKTKERK